MLRWYIGADDPCTPSVKVLQAAEHRNSARRKADLRWRESQHIGGRSIEACEDKIAPKNDDRDADRINDFNEARRSCIYGPTLAGPLVELAPATVVGIQRVRHFAVGETV